MAAILLSGPAVEPWTVDEAKAFLRVEHDDDDTVIGSLVAAARGHVEALTRRALITQSWRFVRDGWPPDRRIGFRMGPLQSLVAARVYDAAGAATSLDATSFMLDAASGVIGIPSGVQAPGRPLAGIELDLTLGFGAAGTDIPDVLRHAIRVLVTHWYENRSMIAIGQSVAMMPGSVNAMIASYRVLSL